MGTFGPDGLTPDDRAKMQKRLIEQYPADLLNWPNDKLAKPAAIVKPDMTNLAQFFIAVMSFKMKRHGGVGLAAPQVGIPFRIFTIADYTGRGVERAFINPQYYDDKSITQTEVESEEGCLSAHGIKVRVKRKDKLTLKWEEEYTREEQIMTFSGYEATIIQHEMDHLDGVCIVDKAPLPMRIQYLSMTGHGK